MARACRHQHKDVLSWPQRWVTPAAGRMESGVALPCASAKRTRLLPEVFDDCSYVGCGLSPLDRAIMREFERDDFFFEFPGDWRYLSRPQDWHHLHFTVSTL